MKPFLFDCGSLFYHRYTIRIVSKEKTVFDAWPGVVIRNNLLYAADKIMIPDTHNSLRQFIDQLPLSESHPFFKKLQDGFSRGYKINIPDIPINNQDILMKKGSVFSFSLILIGSMNRYCSYFFDAIRKMCENGLGHPKVPFSLIEIEEKSPKNESRIMATGTMNLTDTPLYPVRFADFLSIQAQSKERKIQIVYETPMNLIKPKRKKDYQLSYQDKCNLFPGFYQLVRSAAYRLEKLCSLYVFPEEGEKAVKLRETVETYLENAGLPTLYSADIQHIQLKNTLKKEQINNKPLTGYIGKLVFEGYFNKYLPLLKFMEELGVGNDLVYGLGKYSVEIGE